MTGSTYTPDERSTWLEFYERVGEPGPYHHPEYLEMLAGNFEHETEEPELFVFESGDDVVYYPYLRRSLDTLPFAATVDDDLSDYSDIVSTWYWGGPVLSDGAAEGTAERFAEAFTAYCEADDIVAEFIRFNPNLENHRDFEILDPRFDRETVTVDLRGSRDDIWEGYEGRNQRAIRQAQDAGIVVEPTSRTADVARFHDVYSSAMEARDAAEHYRFSQAFFERLLESSLFSLLVARHEGEFIGGFVVAHDERVAHHYLSASNPDYWDLRVNNLLYHEVVLHMHETGRDLFDFQGGRPGVFTFKKGFSPDRGEFYVGNRVHSPDLYEELTAIAAENGVDTESDYFPAYRVEQSN